MCIFPAHKQTLLSKYGLPELEIEKLEKEGIISSLTPEQLKTHLGRNNIEGSGLLFRYPSGATTIRLDIPLITDSGKPQRYVRPTGEPNSLFIPPGFDLAGAQDLWLTEGEAKALCGHAYGLPIAGLSGIWNWRTPGEEASLLADGEKLSDEEALLPELAQGSWRGKKISLLYDSDITDGHRAYPAFERLAEQLYRLGAEDVRILSLPSTSQGQKVGLDEFILARGPAQALQDLQAMKNRKEPYLPIKAGALTYAERLISSKSQDDKLKATTAYFSVKGEFLTGEWLKDNGLLGERRKALLKDAKLQLKELHRKPSKPSSQDELSQSLGSEYDKVRTLLQLTEKYSLDSKGRLQKTEIRGSGDNVQVEDTTLCNFAAWPLREILKDSGASLERYLELQGILQSGAPLPPVKILLSEFLDKAAWPGLAWGAKAAIRPFEDKEVRYCIQQMAQGIPETVIYTHLGWRKIKGSWVYLHAGGAIGSDEVEVEISDRLRRYTLPGSKGDMREAIRASLSLLNLGPKAVTYSLEALVYLAPLCELLRKATVEPSFLMYLWGTSGSFKSTLSALFLSHFGYFEPKGLPASFRDTANSIEELAFQAKDTLLPVDDLYPAKNLRERAKLEGVLEYLLRNQGDRQGKGRLESSTKQRPVHPPRGLILSSGEVQPLSGSSLARAWLVHIKSGDFDLDRKIIPAQAQQDLLSHAMRGYLEYLAPQLDALSSQLQGDFEYLREQAKKTSKTRTRHGRLDKTVAFLYLGFQVFINYAVTEEAITQEEAANYLQEAWKTFNEVADDLAQVAEREEPTKQFFEAILELQTLGRIYFASMEDVIPETGLSSQGAVKIGWGPDEKGVYYLLWGPAWEQVNKYLKTQDENLSLSRDDLLDSIEQKGLLDRTQKDRRSIVKKIAGKPVRVLPIQEKAFSLKEEEDNV